MPPSTESSRSANRCQGAAALTLWEARDDVNRLAFSGTYRGTVRRLEQTGLLRGDQTVEVFNVASLDIERLRRAP